MNEGEVGSGTSRVQEAYREAKPDFEVERTSQLLSAVNGSQM